MSGSLSVDLNSHTPIKGQVGVSVEEYFPHIVQLPFLKLWPVAAILDVYRFPQLEHLYSIYPFAVQEALSLPISL